MQKNVKDVFPNSDCYIKAYEKDIRDLENKVLDLLSRDPINLDEIKLINIQIRIKTENLEYYKTYILKKV